MRTWKYRIVPLILLIVILATAQVRAAPAPRESLSLAPTYTIFATRQGLVGYQTANGHIIQPRDRFVALPSWRNLSSYRGNEYQVRLTYNGRSVVAPVWDVGPWNTNDNYWSPDRDNYRDLPVGVPMAQAAYLNGYNGGRDQFGRRINNPNGIDIADGTFWDDLGMTRNDWVQVTFLWLGEDPGPGGVTPAAPPPQIPAQPDPSPDAPAQVPDAEPLDNPQVKAGAITVDNDAAGYTASGTDWEEARCGLNGRHRWVASITSAAEGEHRATWVPQLTAGFYEVKAYIPSCGSPQPTASARYRVTYRDGVAEVQVNQATSAGTWVSLGTYSFDATGSQVALSNVTGDRQQAVRFDAMAWIARTDTTPPEARITSITRQRNGFLVEWDGEDDISGIASYDVQVHQLPRGGWRDWRIQVTETSAWFGPDEGRHFAFRVRARDHAGNEAPWPEEASMDTTGVEPWPQPSPTAEPLPVDEPVPVE